MTQGRRGAHRIRRIAREAAGGPLFLASAIVLLLGLLPAAPADAQKRVAFSFDDVPRHAGGFFTPDQRTVRLIAALDRAGIEQAAFFVTPGKLETPDGEGGEDRIRAYVAAGHVLGNHTMTHPWLSKTPVADYLADLDAAAEWLEGHPGVRPWFRYPYLDEGRGDPEKRDAVREALRERGLQNGYVTIDNYDWALDSLASEARREGRPMDTAALCELYTETLVQASDHFDRLAVDALGRSPAHVLLLHETDLAALCLDDLADGLRSAGWSFVPIDEAYRDPIADVEPDTMALGSGRVAALAHLAGRDRRTLNHERSDEEVLRRLFEERVTVPAAPDEPGPDPTRRIPSTP